LIVDKVEFQGHFKTINFEKVIAIRDEIRKLKPAPFLIKRAGL